MALPRFYLPTEQWNLPEPTLLQGEAKHCASVMRRGVGDEIVLFDGAGAWARGTILTASAARVTLQLQETQQATPIGVALSLLQAIPKGGNMELIIEKAVELGVNHIHPVLTQHTVVKLDAEGAAKKQIKWQQIALEACKQCGQNWMPTVHLPVPYESVWRSFPSHDLRIIAALQPDARALKPLLSDYQQERGALPESALIVIGPEGDFSESEYALARQHGCRPMTLGPIILRVETAAMFSLSVLSHELHRHP